MRKRRSLRHEILDAIERVSELLERGCERETQVTRCSERVWSPDGKRVAVFMNTDPKTSGLYAIAPDGSGSAEP